MEKCASLVNKGDHAVQVIGNGDVFDHEVNIGGESYL